MQVHFEVIKVEAHRFFGIKKDGKGKRWEEIFFFPLPLEYQKREETIKRTHLSKGWGKSF